MIEKQYEQQIPIEVYGSTVRGELFQENTSTMVVAQKWATIGLRHSIEQGSELIIVNRENGNQAEFVVDSAPSPNEVKVQLRDHTVDIWELDFGIAPEPAPDLRPEERLVCKECGTKEAVRLEQVDADRLEAAGVLLHYCPSCMYQTQWEKESVAEARAAEATAVEEAAEAPGQRGGIERRKGKRVPVKVRARIRRPGSEEVVEAINVSRGGICFLSQKSYGLSDVVWVAMHYTEGAQVFETPSRIVRLTPGKGGKPNAYGLRFDS